MTKLYDCVPSRPVSPPEHEPQLDPSDPATNLYELPPREYKALCLERLRGSLDAIIRSVTLAGAQAGAVRAEYWLKEWEDAE